MVFCFGDRVFLISRFDFDDAIVRNVLGEKHFVFRHVIFLSIPEGLDHGASKRSGPWWRVKKV
jgi:hypothetical protein